MPVGSYAQSTGVIFLLLDSHINPFVAQLSRRPAKQQTGELC
jgi:hypothetical protein